MVERECCWFVMWQCLKSNDPGGGHELRNTLRNVFSISGSADGTQSDGVRPHQHREEIPQNRRQNEQRRKQKGGTQKAKLLEFVQIIEDLTRPQQLNGSLDLGGEGVVGKLKAHPFK